MRVYIATAMANRDTALNLAEVLRAAGHVVTSAWHDVEPASEDGLSETTRADIARANFAAIDDSRAVVFLDHPKCRGALVEVGYAYGQCAVIGFGPLAGRSLMAELCASWTLSWRHIVEKLEELEILS